MYVMQMYINLDRMITNDQLYFIANALGSLAMVTVVAYHFIAVNAPYVTQPAK